MHRFFNSTLPQGAAARAQAQNNLYLKERLPALKLKNDEVSEADLEKHLKDKWKTLAADKKSKFDDEHKVLLKKYDEAVAKAKAAAANATIVDEEEDGDEDEGDDE
ncbi:hypothetical protein T492DRAFT_1143104 [Pavlovales sp. CCMP2436]|nr:hypothetical protein T492DRAFT_1143104 [Pavlovales sp. CCMP2436]